MANIENIKIEIEVDVKQMEEADQIMQKMIKALNTDELLKIKKANLIKTIAEIEVEKEWQS